MSFEAWHHQAAPLQPRSEAWEKTPFPTAGSARGRARPMPAQALPAALTAPPRPWPGSVLPDKPRLFAGHKVLVQPSTQSGSIIRGGPQRRGRGRRPHNAHEWPPLLCLGRKGRTPGAAPQWPHCAEPPPNVPSGCLSPPAHPESGRFGGLCPRRECFGVNGGAVVTEGWSCWSCRLSPLPAVVLGDEKADLGWPRAGSGCWGQGTWARFVPIIQHSSWIRLLDPLPARAILAAKCGMWDPWEDGAAGASPAPTEGVKQKPGPKPRPGIGVIWGDR